MAISDIDPSTVTETKLIRKLCHIPVYVKQYWPLNSNGNQIYTQFMSFPQLRKAILTPQQ